MKVLFAVNNENVSESIVKKYQKEFKEIISYKNVYYFNAILKELQKDKSYDRIVIGEDLEQFTNSSYEQMDKFIFERLDSISDEASNTQGNDIPIILICADRRNKGEQILVKLFGIGIYNAIIGTDRSVDEVCRLIYKPRIKKEAKLYYRIDVDDVTYQSENENDVSEVEIQNILAHYKRLGRQEERYIESFDNIAEQYNDKQLRIICKFLPLNVKAVLEEQSPKYQKVMSFNSSVSDVLRKDNKKVKKEKGITGKMLTSESRSTLTKPVVIPSNMNSNNVTRMTNNVSQSINKPQIQQPVQRPSYNSSSITSQVNFNGFDDLDDDMFEQPEYTQPMVSKPIVEETIEPQTPKRGRGRPRKNPMVNEQTQPQTPKRGRGRPRKNPLPEPVEDVELPGFEQDNQESDMLPGFESVATSNNTYSSSSSYNNNTATLPGLDVDDDKDDGFLDYNSSAIQDNPYNSNTSTSYNNAISSSYDKNNYTNNSNTYNNNSTYNNDNTYASNSYNNIGSSNYTSNKTYQNDSYAQSSSYNNMNSYPTNNYSSQNSMISTVDESSYITQSNVSNLLTGDKKLISVVGTSKNGTSFVINNVAQQLSSIGINTAILDTTANRNSYYIYTKNEEDLRKVAVSSIEKLVQGTSSGIKVNSNLTVYTSLPDQNNTIKNSGPILETLVKNHSVVLIDCDFETPQDYFKQSQEIYLVQSMDVLTIQPLTAFLRDLKAKNILDERKIRIIINKFTRVRSVTEKTIIGGMAFYNDPAMSFMTELFDRNMVKYVILPFEEETYTRYLEALVNCEMSLKGYSKTFLQYLKQLASMMYPLVSGKGAYKQNTPAYSSNGFSSSMNDTLNQMKRNY